MKICASSNRRSQNGSSLIEVLMALLILSVLVVGTVASTVRLNETVVRQGCRRAAVAAAQRRMEEVRSVLYAHFSETEDPADGIVIGSSWVYLAANTDRETLADPAFSRYRSDPEEKLQVNGRLETVRTRVRFVPVAPGSYAAADCLEIEVAVDPGTGGPVVLRSLYAN